MYYSEELVQKMELALQRKLTFEEHRFLAADTKHSTATRISFPVRSLLRLRMAYTVLTIGAWDMPVPGPLV